MNQNNEKFTKQNKNVWNMHVKFYYNENVDKTYLLVRFPGDGFYTNMGAKNGKCTQAECEYMMRLLQKEVAKKGYTTFMTPTEPEDVDGLM